MVGGDGRDHIMLALVGLAGETSKAMGNLLMRTFILS